MPIYVVTHKTTGAEKFRYHNDSPVAWPGLEFETHEHLVEATKEDSVSELCADLGSNLPGTNQ